MSERKFSGAVGREYHLAVVAKLEAALAASEARLAEVERERDAIQGSRPGGMGAGIARSDAYQIALERMRAAEARVAALSGALMGVAVLTFTDGRLPCFCAELDGWNGYSYPSVHEDYCVAARTALANGDAEGKDK